MEYPKIEKELFNVDVVIPTKPFQELNQKSYIRSQKKNMDLK